MFSVGKAPWHNIGVVLDAAPTVAEAAKLANGHNYIKCSLAAYVEDDGGMPTDTAAYLALDDQCAIVRDDGKPMGTVGAGYEVVQPIDSWDFFSPYVATGKVTLETGGTLADGRKMWGLAKLSEAEVIKGDSVSGYFLIYTSFDGSLAHGIKRVATRVVCQNTLSMALGEKASLDYRFKHTAKIHDRIDAAQADISRMLGMFEASVEGYKVLASKRATGAELVSYVRRVFEIEGKKPDEVSAKMLTKVNRVIEMIDDQRGLDLVPAARGTMWQGYNAVSEYLTHEIGRSDDSRLQSQWFGESSRVNARALELALSA